MTIAFLTTKFSLFFWESVCKWGRGNMAKRGDLEGLGNRTKFTAYLFDTVNHV